jgi:ELWxxDGT repeat protein
VNGTLFFSATNAVSGKELWKSNGTAAGTVLVKDINPGSYPNGILHSSYPFDLTNVNGTLFFQALNGVSGIELWKSNGSAAGTVLVKDINSGSGSSSPVLLTNVNSTLFFRANNGVSGIELWKSNGTAAGTVLVKDINPGSGGSNPFYLTNVNGTLFFSATNGVSGQELWQSNGATPGTVLVKDINPGSGNSNPSYLTNVNGTLFFDAIDAVHGAEPWVLGPVLASAPAAWALVVPRLAVPGPAAGFPLDTRAAVLPVMPLSDRQPSGIASADTALRLHLLLEESLTPGTRSSESARRSPAVLGTKSQPHLPGDSWSEGGR